MVVFFWLVLLVIGRLIVLDHSGFVLYVSKICINSYLTESLWYYVSLFFPNQKQLEASAEEQHFPNARKGEALLVSLEICT